MWVECVKASGLGATLSKICAPDTHLELSMPHITQSFRHYSWKESFGEILERWTPVTEFSKLSSNPV